MPRALWHWMKSMVSRKSFYIKSRASYSVPQKAVLLPTCCWCHTTHIFCKIFHCSGHQTVAGQIFFVFFLLSLRKKKFRIFRTQLNLNMIMNHKITARIKRLWIPKVGFQIDLCYFIGWRIFIHTRFNSKFTISKYFYWKRWANCRHWPFQQHSQVGQ